MPTADAAAPVVHVPEQTPAAVLVGNQSGRLGVVIVDLDDTVLVLPLVPDTDDARALNDLVSHLHNPRRQDATTFVQTLPGRLRGQALWARPVEPGSTIGAYSEAVDA